MTQSEPYVMVAFHVVEKMAVQDVLEVLAGLGLPPPQHIDASAVDVIVPLPGADSWCSVYDFGSVAFFNAAEAQQQQIIGALRSRFKPVERDITSDDFRVVIDAAAREQVAFGHAVLNEPARAKIGILALLLAQSATLEYYEQLVEGLLDSAEQISEPMKSRGKLPAYNRDTIRFIGISLSTRRDLVSRLYILDEPESTWEDVALDRLFKQMKKTLDIDVRYRALEYKLRLIGEGVDVIVELTNAQRNIFLEAVIVILIIVEIVLALGMVK